VEEAEEHNEKLEKGPIGKRSDDLKIEE